MIGTLSGLDNPATLSPTPPLRSRPPGGPALLDGTWPAETPDDAQPLLRRRCGSRLPDPPGSRRVTPRFWWCARAEETLRTRPRHTSACPPQALELRSPGAPICRQSVGAHPHCLPLPCTMVAWVAFRRSDRDAMACVWRQVFRVIFAPRVKPGKDRGERGPRGITRTHR